LRLRNTDASDLLRESGAPFLRYFTQTFERPTEFWYTECSKYSPDKLSKDTRRQIREGRERCAIKIVSPEWLAANGYPCYLSAFARYQNSHPPESLSEFQQSCLAAAGGPFDYWGVFADKKLIGYLKCIIGNDYVACSELKLNPEFLVLR